MIVGSEQLILKVTAWADGVYTSISTPISSTIQDGVATSTEVLLVGTSGRTFSVDPNSFDGGEREPCLGGAAELDRARALGPRDGGRRRHHDPAALTVIRRSSARARSRLKKALLLAVALMATSPLQASAREHIGPQHGGVAAVSRVDQIGEVDEIRFRPKRSLQSRHVEDL